MNIPELSMSRRIRRTPFTNRVEESGVSGFTVVNHMLMPKSYKNSVEEDYWHLSRHVQLWDVSCQRQVQIKGKDAEKLIQYMTPRLIKNMTLGKCFYLPLIDENAGMINDPILLKLDDNKFWLSVADSDVILWAKGLANSFNFKVEIEEPIIYPLAIQGPKSEEVMVSVFGKKIKSIKYFHFNTFDFEGSRHIIARSGYSKQDGFEIYFSGFENGYKLWDKIINAGKEFNILPGCPNLIDRIEAGLISYGNEFNLENNPYECNLGKYCSENSDHDYVGKEALKKIQSNGIEKKIMGVIFEGNSNISCSNPFPVYSKSNKNIGQITSAVYSPRLEKNIGLAMILKDFWIPGEEVFVRIADSLERKGLISSLPFQ